MQELRLLGVHQDENHVLLVAANGTKFQLAIDDSLRAAIRRVPPRRDGHDPSAIPSISPREIQAQIRAGETAEHIADTANLPLEHVQRYEGPVLAERSHICEMAKQQQVRGDFEDGPPRLGELVEDRLVTREVHEPGTWDSWRLEDGSWVVQLTFVAGGRERRAQWSFRPSRAHLEPLDDESRWFTMPISEVVEPPVASNPAYSVRPTPAMPTTPAAVEAEPSFASTDELLEHLQAQRGVRADGHDNQVIDLAEAAGDFAHLPPAAHGFNSDLQVVENHPEAPLEADAAIVEPTTDHQPAPAALPGHNDDRPAEVDVRDSDDTVDAPAKSNQQAKARRPKVPSWDEIMFGSRKD